MPPVVAYQRLDTSFVRGSNDATRIFHCAGDWLFDQYVNGSSSADLYYGRVIVIRSRDNRSVWPVMLN